MNICYKENLKGFTLIELLVVIAIIGLLATIAAVSLNNARVDARNTKRLADMKQIAIALELYNEKYGDYPSNGQGSGSYDVDVWNPDDKFNWDSSCGDDVGDGFLSRLFDEGFLTVIPKSPYEHPGLCYLYSSHGDLTGGHTKGHYYLMVAMEPYDNSNVVEQSCPGLDFSEGSQYFPYPYFYCVSIGTENLVYQ